MRSAVALTCVLLSTAACGGAPPSAWEALPLGTKADFRDIWFTDAMHGWISGGSYDINGGLVGRTTDGGKTWRFVSDLTTRDRTSVMGIHFFDNQRGIAAAGTGTLLESIDGGATWESVTRQGRTNDLHVMSFLDDRRGWAAGTGDVIRTDDGGENWAAATTENGDTSYRSPIRAIQFVDERTGWVTGMQSYLARSSDGGATWEEAAVPVLRNPTAAPGTTARPTFWDLHFVDDQFGWVVGEEGSMISTTDGGITWTRRSMGLTDAQSAPKLEQIPKAGGTVTIDAGDRTPGFTVSAVRFLDRHTGWIAGYYAGLGRSLILRTVDAGMTWVVDADVAGEELRVLFLQGRETVWAIGDRVREGAQAIYRRSLVTK